MPGASNFAENEKKVLQWLILFIGVAMSCFHLYATTTGTVSLMIQREVHLGLAIVIAALVGWSKQSEKEKDGWFLRLSSIVIIFTAAFATFYLISIDEDIVFHLGDPTQLEIVLATLLVLSLLEMTRRVMGWTMPIIAIVAILYAFYGKFLPGGLAHRGYGFQRLASYLFLSDDGVYGVPIGVSSTVVIMFIIFGSFLQSSGAGKVFKDGAFALFGRVRGGPAKISVFTSALFGTINGSAIANVVTTGTFTIPLMKSVGYEPHFAGAVEAVASTGGQIMPPIMGAAAFIMAQVLGIPYSDVAIAAVIPAALYFYMCFVVIHLQAVKSGMKAYATSELPNFKDVMTEGWHVIITLAALFYMLLGMRLTPNKTALYCCAISVLLSWFSKNDKMTLKVIIWTLKEAAEDVVPVALACGTAGIIIGVLGLTGLGLKLSSLLVLWSGGNLIILLILTMITGFVLGMGLPTTGVYIILSVLAAPALVNMGVSPISAHFFVFYYGVLAAITPPVALASYAGAGIAGANYTRTGWEAVKLGSAGFLVPFIFVFAPAILMQGSVSEIAHVTFTAFVGVTALSMSLQGYPAKGLFSRCLLGLCALLLLDPGLMTDVAGVVLVAGVLVVNRILKKREIEAVLRG